MSNVVVITGSTRGIGLGLALKFLEMGDRVVISSRSEEKVDNIVNALTGKYPDKVMGKVADITKFEDVKSLAQAAVDQWNSLDIWVNNAALSNMKSKFHDLPAEDLAKIVDTNVLGILYSCKVAIEIMKNQINGGKIYNTDGLGSDGNVRSTGLTPYMTTKRSIPFIAKSLTKEYKDTKVKISTISPGMVVTDLLIDSTEKQRRRIFNILADTTDNVADYLVPKMRENTKSNAYIKYLTTPQIFLRFLTAFNRRNKYFDKDGNRLIQKPEEELLGLEIRN